MTPLCHRDTDIRATRLVLEHARGDTASPEPDAWYRSRNGVSDEARALHLDNLVVLASDGTVLGAIDPSRIGARDAGLAALLRKPTAIPTLRSANEAADVLMEAHCVYDGVAVGIVGSRAIGAILERIGQAHAARVTIASGPLDKAHRPEEAGARLLKIDALDGLSILAMVPRDELSIALRRLDQYIVAGGCTAIAVALIIALGLARSLSDPLAELSYQTREIARGSPKQVRVRGSKEIRQLAQTFNEALDELARMRNRLATTERIAARREVAHQIAHEIKNPLAPIRAAVETLRRLRERDDPRFDEYFEEATATVLGEVHRIANIVTEFTRFNRMPPPRLEAIDIVEVARGVVQLHAARLEPTVRSGPRLATVELRASEVPLVAADRDQIIQVLTNLVQNGLEAARAVRDDPRVVVIVGPHAEGHVRIVVRDNGPGVPETLLPRLFEPYATTKSRGTGLGLAIVQRIVFEHGGEIAYRKAKKGGAVFEVVLRVSGPALLERPPPGEGAIPPGDGSKVRHS